VPNFKDKPFLKQIYAMLDYGKQLIEEDKCSEDEACKMLSRFNAESKGFFDKKSFVNYDKAMRIVGIKQRTRFKEMCDIYNIEQKTINNQKVGFLRTDIEGLKEKLREENKREGKM
jgi:hypothetical protein